MTPDLFSQAACDNPRASRHILCVRLRNWPIDRLRRNLRRRDPAGPARDESPPPLALIETVGNRRLVAASCGRARSLGVRRGIDQAEAMAVCPSLACLPHDPVADMRGLRSLGRWMMRFTPVVAVANGPEDPLGTPDALMLDVTGCERVFHGMENLVRQVVAALERFGLDARVALGPNPGAAWARTFKPCPLSPVSRGDVSGTGDCPRAGRVEGPIVKQRQLTVGPSPLPSPPSTGEREQDLPCHALRLDADAVAKLYHLGIRTIGQLLAVPREQLPARFGPQLTLRLDQLLGVVPEPLVPLEPPFVISAKMDFDGVVTSFETLWAVFRELLGRVITQLERRGRGVRELEVTFARAYATPIVKTIRLSRPSRDPVNLFNLFRCATEQMVDEDASDEFLGMRLVVRVHEPLADEQIGLLDGEHYAGEMELDRLIERLCARLGEWSVTQPETVESHLPERTVRPRLARDARSRTGSLKRPGRTKTVEDDPRERHASMNVRPLCLLPRPLEVPVTVNPFNDQFGQPMQFVHRTGHVHRLTHVVGPERIGGRWWDAHDKTRDYFDVEDEGGERFWLFRVNETRRWYLHGQYA